VEDESPWVGQGPQGFCKVLSPMDFFDRGFFSMWAFLALPHMGQGQIDTSNTKFKKIQKVEENKIEEKKTK